MTTLSPTKARANLTSWLKAAVQGEDVGILYGDHVVALRPVVVESADYALREYGATAEDLRRTAAKAHDEIEKDRKAGRLHRFEGDIGQLLADQAH
jgi:antitoxin (DNA-binding transcriptional repressor) of toxin-antitoxin stability system